MNNSHTTTLFHYTRRMDTLLSILKGGLKFSYACENFGKNRIVGIPMISFCDIPLRQSGEHKTKYGSYAIGLSKDVLQKIFKGALNPVMYCVDDRQFNAAYKIRDIYNQNKNLLKKTTNEQEHIVQFQGKKYSCVSITKQEIIQYSDVISAFFENMYMGEYSRSLIGYMKPYYVQRKGKTYVAYDECEWRVVLPEYAVLENNQVCNWIWNDFNSWKKEHKDKFVESVPSLTIDPQMLSYIIVPTIDKADHLFEKITKNKIFGEDSANICSKIISFEQIEKDF